MNKIVTIVLAVVLMAAGAFYGNKIGTQRAIDRIERVSLQVGTVMYESPTASAEKRRLMKQSNPVVLEKIKYNTPTVVHLNNGYTAKDESGAIYKLKGNRYYKYVSMDNGEGTVTIMADTNEGGTVQLTVPKGYVYPVDEGEWTRVRDKSIGDKWIRTKSMWYNN